MHKQLCMNCMAGYIRFGTCSKCGARNTNPLRDPIALPMRYGLSGGRYMMGRVLGAGGFGITYLSWDNKRNSRVTIKELCPKGIVVRDGKTQRLSAVQGREEYFNYLKKRFREEAQTISYFQAYPEILKIYDAFEENGTVYYSMEYLEGETLIKYAQRTGSMDWETYKKPIYDIIQSLRILHDHEMIHRDISPDNMFITANGTTKLIDFGSVRYDKADHFTTIFKTAFAPPEMHSSKGKQGPWTDIYSLCASCYYILSKGKLPALSYDRAASLSLSGKDSLVSLRTYNPQLPEYLYDVIHKGLSIEKERRYLNVNDLQTALFPESRTSANTARCCLVCVQGRYQGKMFPLQPEKVILLGRGTGNGIAYPENPSVAKGISRKHCAFYVDRQNKVYLQDQKSTYGTYLKGKRVLAGQWYRVPDKCPISIGTEVYYLRRL